ncbi:MAG: sigma-70 family RNA polymerase sigma factor [Planctomycetia bacterium]|nr:sigma-70 family RNA polymerase sigma factor [Planctomycetia bacterium]
MWKKSFFGNNPKIPIYFKLCIILFQTLAALERKYLKYQKQSLKHEIPFSINSDDESSQAQISWEDFAETMTLPLSKITRSERNQLLHDALKTLTEADREILILRHFDGLSIQKCADSLGITAKAASMRHIRAIACLQ